jgi:tetratricopeptide (TPR) repeat protein
MPDMSKTDLDRINKLKTIKALIAQRDFIKAREYYDEMPDDLKKQKLFQMIHIQIGSGLGDERYGEAMNEYRALFPNDPNMYLMMIDAYVLDKDYPKALAAVNKLDSFINKDPFQDYYRGLMYKLMEDSLQSRACFERLHAYMPRFSKGTIELIVSYAKTGDMDKAVKLMKQAKGDKTLSPAVAQLLCELHPDLKKAVEADQ